MSHIIQQAGASCAEKALLIAQLFSTADDALFIKHLARVLRMHPQFAVESADGGVNTTVVAAVAAAVAVEPDGK